MLIYHSNCLQPRLDEPRPLPDRQLACSQAESVAALCVQVHFHWHSGHLQCEVVRQRLLDTINGIILGLHQEGWRCVGADIDV